MAWSDDSDAPALRLRTWPVRNAETLDAEPVEYEGVLPKRGRSRQDRNEQWFMNPRNG